MDDLISRQAAIKEVEKESQVDGAYGYMDTKSIVDLLEDLPSARPERKKGRWLPDNGCGGGYWVCSSCKNPTEAFAAYVLYKYCPFCGAYMRQRGDDKDD